jgi:hypothetical protein
MYSTTFSLTSALVEGGGVNATPWPLYPRQRDPVLIIWGRVYTHKTRPQRFIPYNARQSRRLNLRQIKEVNPDQIPWWASVKTVMNKGFQAYVGPEAKNKI